MKKKYINPELKIVNVVTTDMIAISQAELRKGEVIESSDDFGARGDGGFWDDDDEY